MLEWFAENSAALQAVVALIGSVVTLVILPIFVFLGKMSQKTAQAVAKGVELGKGATIRTLKDLEKKFKDGKITAEELATAIDKGIKRECAEQAVRSGFKSVVTNLTKVAAEADPKKKPIIGLLGRLFKRKPKE